MARTDAEKKQGSEFDDLEIAELVIQSVTKLCGNRDDLMTFLRTPQNRRGLGALVMDRLKRFPDEQVEHFIPDFPCEREVPHLIPDYVKDVREDVEPTQLDLGELQFFGIMGEDEHDDIGGKEMLSRAREMGALFLGLSDVPTILAALAPLGRDSKGVESDPVGFWRQCKILLLGTIVQYHRGTLAFPYITWDWRETKGWRVNFQTTPSRVLRSYDCIVYRKALDASESLPCGRMGPHL